MWNQSDSGDDRGAVGVFLEVLLGSNPAGLVGDVGGLAIRRDHDAVRDVTDADLRALDRRRRVRSILVSVSLLSSTT